MLGLCMWGCQVPAVTHGIVLALGIDLSHMQAGKLNRQHLAGVNKTAGTDKTNCIVFEFTFLELLLHISESVYFSANVTYIYASDN